MTRWTTITAVVCLSMPASSSAHVGPPYPLFVDRAVGPCVLSVWADPDVGTGTFFLMPEPPPGKELPADLAFVVHVRPADGRGPERAFPASPQQMRYRVQHYAETEFPTEELWRVRITVASSEGGGETEIDVEVTPPGLGPWDLLLYALPFAALGGLWVTVVVRRWLGRRKSERPGTA